MAEAKDAGRARSAYADYSRNRKGAAQRAQRLAWTVSLLGCLVLAWGGPAQGGVSQTLLDTWGTTDGPWDLAVDASGNVYTTAPARYRVQKYDASGNLLLWWGSRGSGDLQFRYPRGIALDASGRVYVADYHLGIKIFDSDGDFIERWAQVGLGSLGIDIDEAGNVYVASGRNRILKLNSNGDILLEWGAYGTGPGQFGLPHALSVEGGAVYVLDFYRRRVQAFDTNGTFLSTWGSYGTGNGQFTRPFGIEVHSNVVYVSDLDTGRIQKFDLSGNFIGSWGSLGFGPGQLYYPMGVTTDSAGQVYVAEYGRQQIQVFGPSETFGGFDHIPLGTAALVENGTDLDVVLAADDDGVQIPLCGREGSFLYELESPSFDTLQDGDRIRKRVYGLIEGSSTPTELLEVIMTVTGPTPVVNIDVHVEPSLLNPSLSQPIDVDFFWGCQLAGGASVGNDITITVDGFQGASGNPFSGIDLSMFGQSAFDREDIVLHRMRFDIPLSSNMSISGQGGSSPSTELRISVRNPAVQITELTSVLIDGRGLPQFTLERQAGSALEPISFSGLDHTPVGRTQIAEEDGALQVMSDDALCDAEVYIDFGNTSAWTVEWELPELSTVPPGNDTEFEVRIFGDGTTGGDLIRRMKRSAPGPPLVVLDSVIHPSLRPSSGLYTFEVFLADSLLSSEDRVYTSILVTPVAPPMGSSDPLDSIDTTTLGVPNAADESGWTSLNTKFLSPHFVQIGPGPQFMADEVRMTIKEPHSVGPLRGAFIRALQFPPWSIVGESIAAPTTAALGGVAHSSLGTAKVTSNGSSILVSNIGSNGEDGVSIDLDGADNWTEQMRVPDWGTLPEGAAITQSIREPSGELVVERSRTKESAAMTDNRVVFGDEFPGEVAPEGLVYEALQGLQVVASIAVADSTDSVTVFDPMGAKTHTHSKGSSDPFNGTDIVLVDKGNGVPVSVTTIFSRPFSIELPGQTAVTADRYRVRTATNGPVSFGPSALGSVTILAADIPTVELLGAGAVSVSCSCSPGWQQPAPVSAPSPRQDHAMAFDEGQGVTVLFSGGPDQGAANDETWEWDGADWTLFPASAPGPRRNAMMAYDSLRKTMVLFGGEQSGTHFGDVWERDTNTWALRDTTALGPGPRTSGGLTFHEGLGLMLFYGGADSSSVLQEDLWSWDGQVWAPISPVNDPGTTGRGDSMIYDSARDRLVLHKGASGETWEWDTGAWNMVTNTGPVFGGTRFGLAYNADCGSVDAFGQVQGGGTELYRYDGSSWALVSPAGSTPSQPRQDVPLVYDTYRAAMVTFGGQQGAGTSYGDTWVLGCEFYSTPVVDTPRSQLSAHPNYPNPFNPETTIRYTLSAPDNVELVIYDLRGRVVKRVAKGLQPAGSHEVVWSGRDHRGRSVSSGTYLYDLRIGASSFKGKMALVK